jgi:hypothetical protein
VPVDKIAGNGFTLVWMELAADEAGHFADVGCEQNGAFGLREEIKILREDVEAIGVDEHGTTDGENRAQDSYRVEAGTKTWADDDGGGFCDDLIRLAAER